MPSDVAAIALLLANLGTVAAVLALSPTPRRSPTTPRTTDRCFVCSATDPETTVSEYPVCGGCRNEYFGAVE